MNSHGIRRLIVIVLTAWLGLLVATYPLVPNQIAMRQGSAGQVMSTAEKSLTVWLVLWTVALILAVLALWTGGITADGLSVDEEEAIKLRTGRTVLGIVLLLLWVNCIFAPFAATGGALKPELLGGAVGMAITAAVIALALRQGNRDPAGV